MPRPVSLAWEGPHRLDFQTPTSGTAPNGLPYFSWDQAAVQLNREGWSWTATPGTPVSITYGFRQSGGPAADTGVTGFQQFNATQIAVTEQLLARWSEVANITFERVGTGYTNNATMLFGNFVNGPAQFSAFAYLPEPGATGSGLQNGDVWVNISRNYDANPLAFPQGAQILLHEIGHTMGLLHASVYGGGASSGVSYAADADFWQDTHQYTVMSYFDESFTGASYGEYWATSPQMFDIAAAQYLYGPNMTTRTGDTVYGFNSNTGISAFSISSAAQGAVFCIWDAGGNDTLDLSGYATASEIDLRPESFSSAGTHSTGAMIANISIARGVIIENAIGGSGNDVIIGNPANNTLIGGAGSDRIDGGDGNDIIYFDAADDLNFVLGGAGVDTLVFTSGVAPTTFNLVAQGFEGAEGRFTVTGGNPWATRVDTYDSIWRLDISTTINDNGTREITDFDQANAVSWASFLTRQDSLLRTTETVLTYDDGGRDTTNFDVTNSVFWTSFVTRTDALARTTETLLIHDDGTRDTTNFDGDNTQFWSSFVTRRDSLGRQTESLLIHDDGTRDTTNYDADNSQFWTSFVTRRDSLGRTTESLLIHDDGTRDTTNYDADNSQFWTSFVTRRDAQGRQTESLLIHDDGTRDTTNFDPENNVFWSSFVTRRDALGHTTDTLLIYDDGRRDSTDYDEGNAFTWSDVVYRYDASGTLYQTITTYDDGHIIIT